MTTSELQHLKILMQEGNFAEVMRLIQATLDKRKHERITQTR